ncbi:MAG: DUF4129 domain-containing protein, partial [Ktedonobacterales bacterium]
PGTHTTQSSPPTPPHTNVIVISPLALTLIVLGIVVVLALCFLIPWLLHRRRIQRGQPPTRMPWFVPGILATAVTFLLLLLLLLPPLINPNPQYVTTRVVLPFNLPLVGSQLQYGVSSTGVPNGGGQGSGQGQGGTSSNGAQPANTPGQQPGANTQKPLQIPPSVVQAVTIGLIVALVVLLLGVGFAIWRSRRKRKVNDGEGVYEIAREQPLRASPGDPFRGDAARVYYRRLLQVAERAGGEWMRRPTETPVEYEARLRGLLMTTSPQDMATRGQTPEEVAALADLTTAYRMARYKGDPTDDQRSERLRERLPRLLDALGGKSGS